MQNEFVSLISNQAKKYGNREALRYRDYLTDQWTSMSWNSFKQDIERCANALLHAGVEPQGKVAVFSQNCPEILITHFASFYNRAIPVPIYATSSKEEAAYIINDSGATVLMVGEQTQYDIALQLFDECPCLKLVVVLNTKVEVDKQLKNVTTWRRFLSDGGQAGDLARSALAKRMDEGRPDDLMYMIYTSGTTGQPKGVMLTHSNFNAAMMAHGMRLTYVDDNDVSLSFLPLSHIFELGWTMYCLIHGLVVAINYNPHDIQRSVKEVSPNCMCSVPRFWEKVYTAIMDNVSGAKPVVKTLFKTAIRIGKVRNIKYARNGQKAPYLIEKQYQYFEKKVYSRLRRAIGVENGKLFPTAGAMLSDNITELLHAVGINIVIGYGLSETNASVCFYPNTGWELGTIGEPIPGVKVKIGDQNEILVKGPTVMRGYYNKPEETAQAIDADGWFHTGDCGELTEKGHLVMTERLKDLYKTSNGKYIAPQQLESLLAQDKYMAQVAVIGDGRKYVSALIVPDFDELGAWAIKHKIQFKNNEELVNDPKVHDMLDKLINEYQKELASYEQIKRFVLLPRPFSMENGELTNTLKIKRAVVNKRYAKLIDAMYAVDYRPKGKKDMTLDVDLSI
ncbi:MAG: long-chain fatty acid--CoA ligase [Muribaculaceae bacterium]|nr:long-chain fatty acid--CoA ligase [Muribaculaceae bacterium]